MGSNRKTPQQSHIMKGGKLADNRKISSNKARARLSDRAAFFAERGISMKNYDAKKALTVIIKLLKNTMKN